MKTLTIAVPTYNMERWLPVTIESCLWQSHKSMKSSSSTMAPQMPAARSPTAMPNSTAGSAISISPTAATAVRARGGRTKPLATSSHGLMPTTSSTQCLRKRCSKRRRGTKWIWSAATRSSSLTKHSTRAAISPIPPRQGSPFPPPPTTGKAKSSGGGYSPSPFCVPERTAARSSIQVISSGRTYASCSKLCHA